MRLIHYHGMGCCHGDHTIGESPRRDDDQAGWSATKVSSGYWGKKGGFHQQRVTFEKAICDSNRRWTPQFRQDEALGPVFTV